MGNQRSGGNDFLKKKPLGKITNHILGKDSGRGSQRQREGFEGSVVCKAGDGK